MRRSRDITTRSLHSKMWVLAGVCTLLVVFVVAVSGKGSRPISGAGGAEVKGSKLWLEPVTDFIDTVPVDAKTPAPGQILKFNGTAWVPAADDTGGGTEITSVSLGADIEVSSSTWTDVPSMPQLTFTAIKPTALVTLTASGYGYTNSMSYVNFRVWNVTTGASIGGTIEKIQSYDDDGWGTLRTITTWSCAFSKQISGLTIGSSYTLKVQGMVGGVLGTYNAYMPAASEPDIAHLTLSVTQ